MAAATSPFSGSITAIITPFSGGKLDVACFEKLIERQIAAGTHGIVPAGTTGESPTLSHDEHNQVIEIAVRTAKGRIPIIAGTGSNATSEAISTTLFAQKVGADAALVIVPYYNKPTPEGLIAHFTAIHDATDIPIILYNVPGRTVVDMQNDVVLKLADLPRIVGIKDATGDLNRPQAIAAKAKKDFIQLSGEDDTVLEYMDKGGIGCISVASNIAPAMCAEMHNLWRAGKKAEARAIQDRLMPLHNLLFCEASPSPAKYLLSLMGLCSEELRLPLVPPREDSKAKLRALFESQDWR